MNKILHVISSLEPAGAEKLLVDLLTQFDASNQLKVDLFVFKSDLTSFMEQVHKLNGINIYVADASSTYAIKSLIKLYRHLKQNHYDIVHAHLTAAQLFCTATSYLLPKRLKFITTEHSTNNRRRNWLFKWLDTWMYKTFDIIICISEAVEKSLNTWLPFTAKKTCIIPNGINLPELNKIARVYEPNSNSKPFNILCIGRLVHEKNQVVLIEALCTTPDTHLYLVGDGECKSALQEKVNQLGLQDRVFFLGKCNNVSEIIARADVYVQPSIFEGFGLAAVEAMAGGLPIVINNVPGLRDVIGDAGILFNNNASQLAEILNTIKQDVNLQQKLSQKSRAKAEEYNISITANSYMNLYSQFL